MGSIVITTKRDKTTGKTVTRYRAHIRRVGFQSKSKLFDRMKEARDWVRENEGSDKLERAGTGKTLSTLIEEFVQSPPRRGYKFWRPEHLDFWNEALGDMKVGAISRGDINGAIVTLQTRPARRGTPAGTVTTDKKLSNGTINKYIATLASLLNFALDKGLIDFHPMKAGQVKKLEENGGRRRILTGEEEERLYTAAKASAWPAMYAYIRMLMTTGARRSEILNLRWEQIDLDRSIAVLGTTKNGRPRALPLVSDVKELLADAAKVKPLKGDFVFFDPRDPERPLNVDKVWEAVRKEAGLWNDRSDPLERVVLHTTRHTAVTKLLRGGANLAQAAAVSGHQTLAMLKRYEHLAAQDVVDVAEKLLGGKKTTGR
ncbi:MAG: tyrosine-type recombinase/integrase [Burkholderiales bacterium]|jgi:integrase|nr:tyrosine-type recombinase/integrase [Burkholderiales bacterium]